MQAILFAAVLVTALFTSHGFLSSCNAHRVRKTNTSKPPFLKTVTAELAMPATRGSAFIVSPTGLLCTALHNILRFRLHKETIFSGDVEKPEFGEVVVTEADGSPGTYGLSVAYVPSLKERKADKDFALLKIESDDHRSWPFVPLSKLPAQKGESTLIAGYPVDPRNSPEREPFMQEYKRQITMAQQDAAGQMLKVLEKLGIDTSAQQKLRQYIDGKTSDIVATDADLAASTQISRKASLLKKKHLGLLDRIKQEKLLSTKTKEIWNLVPFLRTEAKVAALLQSKWMQELESPNSNLRKEALAFVQAYLDHIASDLKWHPFSPNRDRSLFKGIIKYALARLEERSPNFLSHLKPSSVHVLNTWLDALLSTKKSWFDDDLVMQWKQLPWSHALNGSFAATTGHIDEVFNQSAGYDPLFSGEIGGGTSDDKPYRLGRRPISFNTTARSGPAGSGSPVLRKRPHGYEVIGVVNTGSNVSTPFKSKTHALSVTAIIEALKNDRQFQLLRELGLQ